MDWGCVTITTGRTLVIDTFFDPVNDNPAVKLMLLCPPGENLVEKERPEFFEEVMNFFKAAVKLAPAFIWCPVNLEIAVEKLLAAVICLFVCLVSRPTTDTPAVRDNVLATEPAGLTVTMAQQTTVEVPVPFVAVIPVVFVF